MHLSCSSHVVGGVSCMQKTWYIGSPTESSLQGNQRSRYNGQAFLCLRQFEFSDGCVSNVPATNIPSWGMACCGTITLSVVYHTMPDNTRRSTAHLETCIKWRIP